MMKMGKKKLLAIITSATMVVSAALTFAAWDQLSANTTGAAVTMRDKATVTVSTDMTSMDYAQAGKNIDNLDADNAPSYNGTAVFEVKNTTKKTTSFTPTLTITDSSGAAVDASYYTAVFKENNASGTDAAVTDIAGNTTTTKTYYVSVTATDAANTHLGGGSSSDPQKAWTITVTGALSEKPTAPTT